MATRRLPVPPPASAPLTPVATAAPSEGALPGADEDLAKLTPQQVKTRNVRDLAMIALGVLSLGIVAYDYFYRSTLTADQVFLLEVADLAIVLVFVAEFAWRWSGNKWRLNFVLRNWFDILGMVPMMATNIPLFRAFRLLRIGMVASRLLRMYAYATGQQSAQRVFDRYHAALVEEVTDHVMLRTLAMVEDIAAKGGYVRALGDSLHQQRQDIADAAVKGARAGGVGQVVAWVPGAEKAVHDTAMATVDSMVASLRSEEMQRTFEVTVRSVCAEARKEMARKEWKEADPAAASMGPLRRGPATPPATAPPAPSQSAPPPAPPAQAGSSKGSLGPRPPPRPA